MILSMKQNAPESGLLQTMRLYAICTAILIPFVWRAFSPAFGVEAPLKQFITMGMPVLVFLAIYLSIPWWQQRMGRLYLPTAFLLLAVQGLLGSYLTLRGTVPPPSREFAALALMVRGWVQIQFLLLFIAWQYNLFWVMLAGVGLPLLNAALYFPFVSESASFYSFYSMLVIASLTSVSGTGLGFAWLMKRQREQRAALAESNRKLAQYVGAVEQLAESRERNRLARELHDTLAHSLSGVIVQLEAVHALWDVNGEAARQMLEQALQSGRSGLTEARRALQSLRASPLDDLGLALALNELATSVARRTALKLDLDVHSLPNDLTPEVEQCIYRVAQEALANVTRHAQAKSVCVTLGRENSHLMLTVADDGLGFEPATVGRARYGLQGLRERAEIVGGRLEVESQPGQGTIVRLTIA